MRIVFFTSEGFYSDEVFSYMFANVAASFRDVFIVAVRRPAEGLLKRKLKRARRTWHFSGGANTLEKVSSFPLKWCIRTRNERKAQANVGALPRPPVRPRPDAVIYVDTVNGPDAAEALRKLEPDVVIQHQAGILQSQVFEIARIGTLNLHPGINPLNRGPEPIYSALWAREPKWLGATVHFINEGIDTGPVLAYAPIQSYCRGERYPALFVRIFALGVECLVDVLCRLARGERWTIDPPREPVKKSLSGQITARKGLVGPQFRPLLGPDFRGLQCCFLLFDRCSRGERVYRPALSGWRLGFLEIRGALNRLF